MPKHRHHVSPSAIAAFIEPGKLEQLLAPLVPDEADRAFIVRCVIGEGPAHHRGANYVLLSLLAKALEACGAELKPLQGRTVPVPMRIPPHLADEGAPPTFALELPLAPLEELTGHDPDPRPLAAMIDCLTDGPPQHALANVAMVALLGRLLEVLGESKG